MHLFFTETDTVFLGDICPFSCVCTFVDGMGTAWTVLSSLYHFKYRFDFIQPNKCVLSRCY